MIDNPEIVVHEIVDEVARYLEDMDTGHKVGWKSMPWRYFIPPIITSEETESCSTT